VEDPTSVEEETSVPQLNSSQKDNAQDSENATPKSGLASFLGKDTRFLENQLGRPIRIDPSPYGYEWWIYNRNLEYYVQVGIKNDHVVSLYAIGSDVNVSPFKVGQPVEEIYSKVPIELNISLDFKGSHYRFELTDSDMNTQPLIQVGDCYAQLYIDKFTGTLSSVRYMDAETLLLLRPYELLYQGELLKANFAKSDSEEQIQSASEKQIYDITNIMRNRYQSTPLKWDEKTSEVALAHSKDMYETKEFSHSSKKYGELSDRLEAGEVSYQLAGENIAANYVDAPAVMEGWLNSKGHRENLLNEEFTHIGVGVFKKYYTQNFIQRQEY
jgi:uncharacterized protein YkwD